jgi:lysozyme
MPKLKPEEQVKNPQVNTANKDNALKMCAAFIAKFEGCKLESYKCPAGIWTIGYGHTDKVYDGMRITQEQAEVFLEMDVMFFYKNVNELIKNVCNKNQITALTSFSFNVGMDNFKKSTLLKVIKKTPNNFTAIRKEFMRWVYADGKVLNGLKTRRSAEADLFQGISTGASS